MLAFCVKCRQKTETVGEHIETVKGPRGAERNAAVGICAVCGTKKFRFVKRE